MANQKRKKETLLGLSLADKEQKKIMKHLRSTVARTGITFAVLALILTGCQTPPSNRTTLKVLNYGNLSPSQTRLWNDFEAQNPDIAIERKDLNGNSYHNKIYEYAESGNLPDVLYVWPTVISSPLHTQKLLKDLAPFVAKDNLEDKYLSVCLNPAQQAGDYLAMIPLGFVSSHAFYINMEVLNDCGLQPATTYAELKAQAAVLKAKGYETILMPNQETWVIQSCLFSLVAGRFCGEGWEKKILSGEAQFTDPEFVNALTFIGRMYADGVLTSSSLNLSYEDGPVQFAANKSAYYIDGDWCVSSFLTTGPSPISEVRQENFKIAVFPAIEGAKFNKSTSGVLATGWAMSAAIKADSAKADAAWRLVKYLVGKEVQTRNFADGAVLTPSRTDIDYSQMDIEPLQKAMRDLGTDIGNDGITTTIIDSVFHSDVFTPINNGLRDISNGTATAEEVAQRVQTAFNAWKNEQ